MQQIKPRFPRNSRLTWLFSALIGLLIYLDGVRLRFTFPHLYSDSALDMTSRYIAVQGWFSGQGLYQAHSSTYPPASYLLLWPILGWLPLEAARHLWAMLSLLALTWLTRWCFCHCALPWRAQRWFLAAFLLSMTATSVALWLGQLVPFLLVLFTLMLLVLEAPPGEEVGWKREVAAGVLMTLALVKPSVSLPFWWLLVWSKARLRVGVGVVFGYLFLSVAALWFQKNGLQEVMSWAETVNRNGAGLSEGYANLRVWLAAVGLKSWSHPAALAALLWLGWWTHRYRRADWRLRLGVVAVVARLWTYHNSYDDMMLILAVPMLLQIAGRDVFSAQSPQPSGFWPRMIASFQSETAQAQWLLTVLLLLMLLHPGWLFQKNPVGLFARGLSGVTMVLVLAFLLRLANRAEAARVAA